MKFSRGRRVLLTSVAALTAIVLTAAVVAHKPVIGFVLSRSLSLASGYTVRFGDYQLGREQAVFSGVRVTRAGEPFLNAARVDVSYRLRDLLPGGAHRYGLAAVVVARPVLTLIRHADGSFAFPQLGGNAPAAQPAGSAGEPLSFTARVRDGVLRLIDRAPVGADLAEQDVTHLDLDATVRSDARSSARLGGQIVARRVRGAPLERFGFSFRSVYDDRRGFAVHRIRAAAVPLRGLVDYFVHTPAFRVDGGMARDVDIVAYALDFAPGATPDYRIAGGATLGEGQFSIAPLIVPAREVRGRVDLYENGLTFTRIDGNVGGVPLRARGGLYDWAKLAFRIGLVADGELVRLRRLFAFSLPQPLTGPLHAEAVIGGKVAKPIVSVAFSSPQIRYDAIPFVDASGRIAYYDDTVYLEDLRTRFGAAHAALAGRLLTGGPVVDTLVALSAQAPARDIPYAAAVAPDAQLDILGLLSGDAHGYVLRGTLGATGATTGRAFFRIDPKGDGEIGPFAFDRSDGSSLYGALRYERSSSQSGGWLRVDRYRLAQAGSQAVFPVVRLPAFPPLAGVFSGNFVGGGSPSSFALAGAVDASDARIAGLPLGNARAARRNAAATRAGSDSRTRTDGRVFRSRVGRKRDGCHHRAVRRLAASAATGDRPSRRARCRARPVAPGDRERSHDGSDQRRDARQRADLRGAGGARGRDADDRKPVARLRTGGGARDRGGCLDRR